jgi:hypothetical protein
MSSNPVSAGASASEANRPGRRLSGSRRVVAIEGPELGPVVHPPHLAEGRATPLADADVYEHPRLVVVARGDPVKASVRASHGIRTTADDPIDLRRATSETPVFVCRKAAAARTVGLSMTAPSAETA